MASSLTKKCKGKNGCGKFLLREKFSKKTSASDGLHSSCKECCKAYKDKQRADPVKRKREQDQQEVYNQTPAAQAKRRKSTNARRSTRRGKLEQKLRDAFKNFRNRKGDDIHEHSELFGCTLAEFNAHIESLWEDWMNKDNFGINTGEYDKFWQNDHIVPFSAFKTYEELEKNQKIVCWFKNVQPMCAKKNREKKDKFKPEDKEALICRYHVEAVMEEIISIVAQDA